MKILFPYKAFVCLTGFTATTGLPVIAGGCSSHMNKKADIKCAEDDTECQIEKAEKLNGKAAMLGMFALIGAYYFTGQIVPGIF